MGKKVVIYTSVTLALILFLALPNPVFSHHQRQVLGDSTPASELVFPPITFGAGFILPDSPLFLLDRAFQQIRLLTAFTPERRAQVRGQIASERLAELRIMLSRNNPDGINTALTQLNKEVDLSVASLSDAAAQGKDVSLLAREINDTIKLQRKILGVLQSQARGVLKLQLKAARKALKEAKVEVEDELPEDELENEIEDELEDEIEDEVEDVSESARKAQSDLEKLEKHASKAATKALKKREEAIKKAIEKRNEVLRKVEEKLLENEKKRQEKLLKAQEKAAEQARKAIEKAQEAVSGFKEAQSTVEELRNQPVSDNSGSSGSGRSGSDEDED